MKLLMENWKRYIIEEEIEGIIIKKDFESVEQLREFLIKEYKQRDVHLTEEEIDEIMGKWGKKIGKGLSTLALAGGLMGAGAPTQAHADTHVGGDADAPTQQQQKEQAPSAALTLKDSGLSGLTNINMMRNALGMGAKTKLQKQLKDRNVDAKQSDMTVNYSQTANDGGLTATATWHGG